MKQIILLLFVSGFCLNSFSQQNNYSEIYPQVLNYYFNPLKATNPEINKIYKKGKSLKIDTMIVQKDDYLPAELPGFLNDHVILYLSRNDVNHYKGKHSLLVISAVKKNGNLFTTRITRFSKRQNSWTSWGYMEYKFAYNPQTKRFDLVQPVITFTNT